MLEFLIVGLVFQLLVSPPVSAWESLLVSDDSKITVAQATEGFSSDYKEVRRISTTIMQKYPPDKWLYVGIGKSPVAMTAFIKAALGDSAAVNMPLSEMKLFYPRNDFYTEDAIKRLRIHFDHFIPQDSQLAGRNILLIDCGETGQTLVNTTREVANYLEARAPSSSTAVKTFGLARNSDVAKFWAEMGMDSIIPRRSFLQKLEYRRYSEFAEHDSFSFMGNNEAEPYKKPKVRSKERLQNEMRERYRHGNYPYMTEERIQDKVSQIESFVDLKEAFKKRVGTDGSLKRFLIKLAPTTETLRPARTFSGLCSRLLEHLGM